MKEPQRAQQLPRSWKAVRNFGISCLCAFIAFVLITAVGVSWQVAGRSDAAVERLVAQGQLILASLGLLVTTVLAGTTIYYVVLTRRLVVTAAETAQAERDERLRRQADHISAWVTDAIPDDPGGVVTSVQVTIRNASDTPVYRCTVLVRPDWGDFEPAAASDVGDGCYWAVLPPGDLKTDLLAAPLEDLLTLPPVEIIFTDVAGRHWFRRSNGSLVTLAENPGGVC